MNTVNESHPVTNITNIFINTGKENTELQHWKEQLSLIVKQLSEEDDELKPLVQLLVAAIQPSRIYKIRHADIDTESKKYTDLLVVVPSTNPKPFVELEPILEIPYIQNRIVCCSLHNEGSLKNALSQGHIFYSLHCIDENIIYDNDKTNFAVPTPEALDKMKRRIKKWFETDIQKAVEFREMAAYLFEKQSFPLVAFMLHQAIELTYRSILNHLNGYNKKTHSLHTLRQHIRRCAPQLCGIFADSTKEETLLEEAYLNARYKSWFTISNEILSGIFERVTQLQEAAAALAEKRLE